MFRTKEVYMFCPLMNRTCIERGCTLWIGKETGTCAIAMLPIHLNELNETLREISDDLYKLRLGDDTK